VSHIELDDVGVVVVLLNRMSGQHLPRALDIKARVDRGGRLEDFDLRFLEDVFAENATELPRWENHPELNGIIGTMIHLYHEITAQALDNEYQGLQHAMGVRPAATAVPYPA
jgi:hypothetical protein